MGKLNGKAILKVQTANSFAESLNIINIEKGRKERKIRKQNVPVCIHFNHFSPNWNKHGILTWSSRCVLWICSLGWMLDK